MAPKGIREPKITIDDVILYEFSDSLGELYHSADPSNQLARLCITIERLISLAYKKHLLKNGTPEGNLLPDKLNTLSRFTTNEFTFYTKKPLSLEEFQNLIQWISNTMRTLAPNLQMVLSSFAVKVNKKIMNVVAQIDSGNNPQLKLIVKNHTANVDPDYFNKEGSPLPHRDARSHSKKSKYYIEIDEQKHYFSFKNVHVRQSAGGASYFSCVVICLDQEYSLGRKYLEKLLNKLDKRDERIPLKGTQVLTSNTISISRVASSDSVIGSLTQADPLEFENGCFFYWTSKNKVYSTAGKPDMTWLEPYNNQLLFGNKLHARSLPSKALKLIPSPFLELAKAHNQKLNKNTSAEDTLALKSIKINTNSRPRTKSITSLINQMKELKKTLLSDKDFHHNVRGEKNTHPEVGDESIADRIKLRHKKSSKK